MQDSSPLASTLREMRDRCTECGACMKDCAFLRQHGTPGSLAGRHAFTSPEEQKIAYGCSLCGLCTAVCPEKLDPCALFLEIRRRHVEDGHFDPRPYRRILRYEAQGASPLFSWYGLPPGCDTVFFPGCTLPGTRPAVTLQLYRHLRRIVPSLGLVLTCCSKPSHDLGRAAHFHARFDEMAAWLAGHGVGSVLTACPNCTKVFRRYGRDLAVRTVYQVLHGGGSAQGSAAGREGCEVGVHDPCPLREDEPTQAAVRGLLADIGHTVVEVRHHGRRTICCGEGGSVGLVQPALARQWTDLRRREAGGRMLVTSCAGCAGLLGRITPTVHILDLLLRPDDVRNGRGLVARAPFTYLNRILLKWRMKNIVQAEIHCSRLPGWKRRKI